jgi:hypothetical protein
MPIKPKNQCKNHCNYQTWNITDNHQPIDPVVKLKDKGHTEEHRVEDQKELVVAVRVLVELGVDHFLKDGMVFDVFLEPIVYQ